MQEIKRQRQNTKYNGKIDGSINRILVKPKPQTKFDKIDDSLVVINPKDIEVSEEELLKKVLIKNHLIIKSILKVILQIEV